MILGAPPKPLAKPKPSLDEFAEEEKIRLEAIKEALLFAWDC